METKLTIFGLIFKNIILTFWISHSSISTRIQFLITWNQASNASTEKKERHLVHVNFYKTYLKNFMLNFHCNSTFENIFQPNDSTLRIRQLFESHLIHLRHRGSWTINIRTITLLLKLNDSKFWTYCWSHHKLT